MSRPAPSYHAPSGFHWEAIADKDWITPAIGAGRCRWMIQRQACGQAAAATLRRGSKQRPWDYCERHLYGRWIEGGRVMGWRLVANEPGNG